MVKVKVRGQGAELSRLVRAIPLWIESNWQFPIVSFQLEFTPEQMEGKLVITAVVCVAWSIYRKKKCI